MCLLLAKNSPATIGCFSSRTFLGGAVKRSGVGEDVGAGAGADASGSFIVTGAGAGIGRAIAKLFAQVGAAVVVSDIREEAAALSAGGDAYDALLQDYEPGTTGAEIAAIFDAMNRVVEDDAIIAVDVGNNTYSFGRYFEASGEQAVLMSGFTDNETIKRDRPGVVGWLQKPFTLEQLAELLEQVEAR